MIRCPSYYEILKIPEDSSAEKIKSAFRTLALLHHPDKNGNSPESQARFILISNAYEILSDPERRKQYDSYLDKSPSFKNRAHSPAAMKTALPGKTDNIDDSGETLLNYFNFLLWDIEDLFTRKNSRIWKNNGKDCSPGKVILKILIFMDKWVLSPAGYPDYFTEARKLERTDPAEYLGSIDSGQGKQGHRPFTGVKDYFYNIRRRMDKFMRNTPVQKLAGKIPDYNLRLIDCITEAQNYAIHHLSSLHKIRENGPEQVPPFCHSHPCFAG